MAVPLVNILRELSMQEMAILPLLIMSLHGIFMISFSWCEKSLGILLVSWMNDVSEACSRNLSNQSTLCWLSITLRIVCNCGFIVSQISSGLLAFLSHEPSTDMWVMSVSTAMTVDNVEEKKMQNKPRSCVNQLMVSHYHKLCRLLHCPNCNCWQSWVTATSFWLQYYHWCHGTSSNVEAISWLVAHDLTFWKRTISEFMIKSE